MIGAMCWLNVTAVLADAPRAANGNTISKPGRNFMMRLCKKQSSRLANWRRVMHFQQPGKNGGRSRARVCGWEVRLLGGRWGLAFCASDEHERWKTAATDERIVTEVIGWPRSAPCCCWPSVCPVVAS